MSRFNKKYLWLIFIVLILIGIIGYTFFPKVQTYLAIREIERENEATMELIERSQLNQALPTPEQAIVTPDQSLVIPEQALLTVDFITQAPLETEENWTLHEASCEEAAFLQAYLYETGKHMTKEEANKEILKMIDWQIQNFGSHHDLYAEELNKFIVDYIGPKQSSTMEVGIIFDADIEDIKRLINENHPVIVPVTAALLANPYYPYPGYHMLTVIGYTKDRIITNDNGTRHGKSFSYDSIVFKQALEDAGGDILYLSIR